ncbi:hypothetical protein SCLCIDRAFT_29337 [Scleroderma citrinum Foug A]|uniref:Transmembrane protein n=1 Tax=Scleroderma citrinum Foug A TaxID=1036808 RepID=A0A0C3DKH6_9AGAM|nr:hypothetical protein SCLCIDRAFT_29337 [Scleroderma citrinum Foug A]
MSSVSDKSYAPITATVQHSPLTSLFFHTLTPAIWGVLTIACYFGKVHIRSNTPKACLSLNHHHVVVTVTAIVARLLLRPAQHQHLPFLVAITIITRVLLPSSQH